MTDYAAMTNDELNRAVAERQGYTVYHVGVGDTDGYPCFGSDRDWYWDYMVKDAGDCEPLGAWATDISAAAALDFKGYTVHIAYKRNDSVEVDVLYPIQRTGVDCIARALTESWLVMMDREATK